MTNFLCKALLLAVFLCLPARAPAQEVEVGAGLLCDNAQVTDQLLIALLYDGTLNMNRPPSKSV